MKKYIANILALAISFVSLTLSASPIDPIVIDNGPAVIIPGMTTTLRAQGAKSTVFWKKTLTNGTIAEVGQGTTHGVTTPGKYWAWDGDDGGDGSSRLMGSITLDPLEQHISAIGGLSETNSVQLALISLNGAQYISVIEWRENGVAVGTGSTWNVKKPGTYTASVTYNSGGQSKSVLTDPYLVTPAANAPNLALFGGGSGFSYNPVTPPSIEIQNCSDFSKLVLYRNNQRIDSLTASSGVSICSYSPQLKDAGTYLMAGVPLNGGNRLYTYEFTIAKGDIPAPNISSLSNVLRYEDPAINLVASPGNYNNGFTWFKDGVPLNDASTNQLSISKIGSYTVKACALYPDGDLKCKTSNSFTIIGETMTANNVRKKMTLIENVTTSDQFNALTSSQSNITVAHVDGFGRAIQQVQQAASPLGNDIVVAHRYDGASREAIQILPYTRKTSDGAFYYVPSTLAQVKNFYQQSNDHIADTSFPYSETLFEESTLNRALKHGSPGEEWQLTTSHVKSLAYGNNKLSDNVWNWTVTSNGPAASGYYTDGQLIVVESTDENGRMSREYIDKLGKKILRENILEGSVKQRTYLVFDDLGQLAYVIPPKTVGDLPTTPSVSIPADVMAKECYSYVYDQRGRLITKNLPGAGAQYMVYDKWDRLTLSQHANQRTQNKWTFNKYDVHNRLILSGEITLNADLNTAGQTVNDFYATPNPQLRYEQAGTAMHGYTNRSFPALTNQFQAYSVYYFDNYDYLSDFGTGINFIPLPDLGLATNDVQTLGSVTAIKRIILGTQTYLKTVTYYDHKKRVVQVISDNHLGGIDVISNKLDFTSRILKTKQEHHGPQNVTIEQEFTYDATGRKQKAYHTIDGGTKVLLNDNHYNELGQLIEKNLHSTDEQGFLQSIDYDYNIRGWLTDVNAPSGAQESNVRFQDQYGFSLSYTSMSGLVNPTFQPSFNGNIAAFTQSRPSDTGVAKDGYLYQYDFRNQLTAGNYFTNTGTNNFSMSGITYDLNGNIKTLQRNGLIGAGTPGVMTGPIDNLTYSYSGNQLTGVTDSANSQLGFIKK